MTWELEVCSTNIYEAHVMEYYAFARETRCSMMEVFLNA